MKVGFIVECGPQGAEIEIMPWLAEKISAGLEIVEPVPLDSKRKLRMECGQWVKGLLNDGCQRVLILWDLLPAWGEHEGKGCRHSDKEQIFESLRYAGINPADKRIRLICIEKMLESWVLADHDAVAAFLSTDAHKIKVSPCKHPDAVKDPKAVLNKSFRQTRFQKYRDLYHAFRVIQKADLNKLRRSESFRRFEKKLTSR